MAGLSSSFLCDSDSPMSLSFRDELCNIERRSDAVRGNRAQGRYRRSDVRRGVNDVPSVDHTDVAPRCPTSFRCFSEC